MALDGVVIANIIKELKDTLIGGRINKIAQPEPDELLLTIKNNRTQYRLFLSASASLPLIYLTEENKPSPLTAPNFCMLLRKHLNSAKIVDITQPSLERIIRITIEHLNELGDVKTKYLIVELMGKHSNIIFCNEEDEIIDSIKHISSLVSSVREVLPTRPYFIPNTMEKLNPYELTLEQFQITVLPKHLPVSKAIYTSITGFSPVIANELCYRASIEPARFICELSELESLHLYKTIERMIEELKETLFVPNIIYENSIPIEFSSFLLQCYSDYHYEIVKKESISQVLEDYFKSKNTITRIRQKSADLRRVVTTALERERKKYDLQLKQLKDTEKREKYKVYGELLTAYGYELEEGLTSFSAINYYTDEEVVIPLDASLSPLENAKKYFEKYNKLKRTNEALTTQLTETKETVEHLESISNALDIARAEDDLIQLKEELTQYGYLKKKNVSQKGAKKEKTKSKPFHYISSDGYHMYVGKNNFQNEELTFKFASGNDWWFHAKGIAGSHVIVKTNGEELPDRVFEEAGCLAAYYSKAKENEKVEIDYIERKHVKKPNGSKPGFVVYYTNYSLVAAPNISNLTLISD